MVLLSLDLSTTCTGWSVFDIESHKLITYGILKPNLKEVKDLEYPEQQLRKMMDLSIKITGLIKNYKPDHIVIEEIAGSRSRLTQKVLDGLHWIVVLYNIEYVSIMSFFDVSGIDGWRTWLGLKMNDQDKAQNKEYKKLNKELKPGTRKLPIIDAKDLACRYANTEFGLSLNPQENQYDADIGDSVAMGSAWIKFKCPKKYS